MNTDVELIIERLQDENKWLMKWLIFSFVLIIGTFVMCARYQNLNNSLRDQRDQAMSNTVASIELTLAFINANRRAHDLPAEDPGPEILTTNLIHVAGLYLPPPDLPPYADHEDEESKTEGIRTLTALVHNPDVPTESQIRRAKDIKREAQPNCEAPFCNAIRSRNGNRCDIHHRITNLEALRTKQYYLMTNQANLITFCRLHHYDWGHSGTSWRNFTANLDEIIDKAEAAGLAVYSNQIERVVR